MCKGGKAAISTKQMMWSEPFAQFSLTDSPIWTGVKLSLSGNLFPETYPTNPLHCHKTCVDSVTLARTGGSAGSSPALALSCTDGCQHLQTVCTISFEQWEALRESQQCGNEVLPGPCQQPLRSSISATTARQVGASHPEGDKDREAYLQLSLSRCIS